MLCAKNQLNCITLSKINLEGVGFTPLDRLTYIKSLDRNRVMVVLAESYLQKLECKATMEALNYEIASKTFRRFVDDNHVRFQESLHAANF